MFPPDYMPQDGEERESTEMDVLGTGLDDLLDMVSSVCYEDQMEEDKEYFKIEEDMHRGDVYERVLGRLCEEQEKEKKKIEELQPLMNERKALDVRSRIGEGEYYKKLSLYSITAKRASEFFDKNNPGVGGDYVWSVNREKALEYMQTILLNNRKVFISLLSERELYMTKYDV